MRDHSYMFNKKRINKMLMLIESDDLSLETIDKIGEECNILNKDKDFSLEERVDIIKKFFNVSYKIELLNKENK